MHYWSETSPIHCLGCGVRFADVEDAEREVALRRGGMVDAKKCRAAYAEAQLKSKSR